jgi:hypothetical protein
MELVPGFFTNMRRNYSFALRNKACSNDFDGNRMPRYPTVQGFYFLPLHIIINGECGREMIREGIINNNEFTPMEDIQ